MQQIHKYNIHPGEYLHTINASSHAISAKNQNGRLTLWANHDTECKEWDTKCYMSVRTGEEFDKKNPGEVWRFIDTVLLDGGSFVVHVYEVTGRIYGNA